MPAIARRYLAVCALAIIAVTPIAARAASETVVYSFKGFSDGANPEAGLTKLGGLLYGTTLMGGVGKNCYPGYCGTAFSLTPDGTETVLYSFGQSYSDAAYPHAHMINLDGTLYGTAAGGNLFPAHSGDGTIFELSPTGAETVVYGFNGQTLYQPNEIVKVGSKFYGTTVGGGQAGTVYSVTRSGILSVLHYFMGLQTNDGVYPSSTLIFVDGRFYGVTSRGTGHEGDTGCGRYGCGTLFSITPAGAEKIVYTFGQGTSDGAIPLGDLIYLGGKFYGTTVGGGGTGCGGSGCGTVFSVTPDGVEEVLHAFKGKKDGAAPQGSLLEVGGKLYGTTTGGGDYGYGTVFRISLAGAEKVVHAFGASNDGRTPCAGLTKFGGALYGTTNSGGANGVGTVFKVSP